MKSMETAGFRCLGAPNACGTPIFRITGVLLAAGVGKTVCLEKAKPAPTEKPDVPRMLPALGGFLPTCRQ